MDIPRMIRTIATGQTAKAIEIIKRDIALPAVLGRICPAPCEKVCRRAAQDAPVSICLLKRFAAEADLHSPAPYRPVCKKPSGKKVAIVGAGPCGLSAAYYLTQKGHRCVLLEKNERPGGMLRCEQLEEKLPGEILDREISRILALGVELHGRRELGRDFTLDQLREEYDAVFLAIGEPSHRQGLSLPVEMHEKKIAADRHTFQTSIEEVFAGGGALGSRRMCVRAVADGKEAAAAIDQYLCGLPVTGAQKDFNSRLGSLTEEEWKEFAAAADPQGRLEPSDPMGGFTAPQAESEARRCLHCDCRKKKNCKLRQLSTELRAVSGTYKGQRRNYARIDGHPEVLFEPGKCIQCGLCIQVLKRAGLGKGLTFRGRGFGVQIAAALDGSIEQAVGDAGRLCVQVCPTGAWSLKSK
jgi:NADPH-dependent glutamate synthase beta subunit-like oxidoreductase